GARCCFGTRTHVRDKVGKQPSLCPSKGPPPHVWGRPGATRRCRDRNRDTPTRVGTTGARRRVPHGLAVHPHARGDDVCAPVPPPARSVHPHARGDDARSPGARTWVLGTPPRAWGRLARAYCDRDGIRYTPTRVGTTELR